MQTDKQLYLALSHLYHVIADHEVIEHLPHITAGQVSLTHNEAKAALDQYELELGPLPEWASAHNITGEPVLFAQLYTKDGRKRGNGMIYHVAGSTYGIITDMGNTSVLTREEVLGIYEVGDFVLNEAGYLKRLRQNEEHWRAYHEPELEE